MEFTDQQREIMREIEEDLHAWFDREMAKTPEEHHADAIKRLDDWCVKNNALPLEERLRVLSNMHNGDYYAVLASVSDVTWRVNDEDGVYGVVAGVVFVRSIEQVYFDVIVGPPDAAAS